MFLLILCLFLVNYIKNLGSLNSIMFLLIRKKNNNSYHNTTALNSIMFLLIQMQTHKMLQTTLNSIMFLLIQMNHHFRYPMQTDFKFHYVSINSFIKIYFSCHNKSFKFHYVSINSYSIHTGRDGSKYFKFHYVSIIRI